MGKTTAIIQARIGSTRLHGKILKGLQGKTVLQHVIERVQQSNLIDQIIIATTESPADKAVFEEAQRCGVPAFRGSEDDVLSRYYFAAQKYHANLVVRITSDCPLIDAQVIDQVIQYHLDHDFILTTNAGNILSERTYPRGLDCEVFSFDILEKMFHEAKEPHQREHVTPYIYENYKNLGFYKNNIDYSQYRWTLDTEEDFTLIKEIYKNLYTGTHDFGFAEIVALMQARPELTMINAHVEQKKLK